MDVVTGQDFDVVLKERLFAPLGMTTAEVQQGNLDEGLIASLEDLGYLVRFLLQGYHGRGEAMWQTALKQPDFRELLSVPEGASGMGGNGRGSNEAYFFLSSFLGKGLKKWE